MWKMFIVTTALAVVLAACGGADAGTAATSVTTEVSAATTVPRSTVAPTATVAPTTTRMNTTEAPTTTTEPPRITASEIVQAFIDAGIRVGDIVEYDSRTDPNGRLGRPGHYIEKVAWGHESLPCFGTPSWSCGGDIEAFDDLSDLIERYGYLSDFATTPPVGGWWQFWVPGAIARIGYVVDPDDIDPYREVLSELASRAGGDLVEFRP